MSERETKVLRTYRPGQWFRFDNVIFEAGERGATVVGAEQTICNARLLVRLEIDDMECGEPEMIGDQIVATMNGADFDWDAAGCGPHGPFPEGEFDCAICAAEDEAEEAAADRAEVEL